jgi:hypothetical protein
VIAISLAAPTSAGLAATDAPVIAAALAGSVSATVTSWPSATTLAAMAPPMFPSPITPIRTTRPPFAVRSGH